MPFTRETKLITIEQVQEIIPLSEEMIRRLMRTGKMRGAIYGRKWMTTEEWVCEYVERESLERRLNGPKPKRPRTADGDAGA